MVVQQALLSANKKTDSFGGLDCWRGCFEG